MLEAVTTTFLPVEGATVVVVVAKVVVVAAGFGIAVVTVAVVTTGPAFLTVFTGVVVATLVLGETEARYVDDVQPVAFGNFTWIHESPLIDGIV